MNRQKKVKNGIVQGRGIEWTDFTSNPTKGCFHGCEWLMPNGEWANCYAEDVADKFTDAYPEGFEHHYWKPQEFATWKILKPGDKVFVGSMADVFGHWVEDWQIQRILSEAANYPQATFQLLTKNFVRVHNFTIPKNVWVGASSPPDKMWGKVMQPKSKLAWLDQTLKSLAAVRTKDTTTFLSAEPLTYNMADPLWKITAVNENSPVDWVIIGAASDGNRFIAPEEGYVRDMVDFCDMNDVALFFKGNLRILPWAAANWREEFPNEQS